MFTKIRRAFQYIIFSRRNDLEKSPADQQSIEKIPPSPEAQKKKMEEFFSECSDFIWRECVLGKKHPLQIAIAFLDGMVNKQNIHEHILKPLMVESSYVDVAAGSTNYNVMDWIGEKLVSASEVDEIHDFKQLVDAILSGDTVLFVEGEKTAFTIGTKGWETRSIEQPGIEAVARGPREGFVETLRVNTSLLRRKIKNTNLKFEMVKLGRKTHTDVCICYIKGLAEDRIIDTVRRRLKRIKTDAILESGYIEEFIEDAPFSIFPTVGYSEKPDAVAAKVLEGRVAILCDGTPFVLTVPYLFVEALQVSEDYYNRSLFSSFVRCLRLLALGITVSLPALYVALLTYHPGVIPFKLLLTMAASREGIPYSAFTEAFLMGLTFELLREAGIRMPRTIGQAVSIVGALVLGDAAVKSGLASSPMVMVTSITAISSFIIPQLSEAMPFIRFALLITASILGFMGVVIMLVVVCIHACSLRSFGIPYLSPFAPVSGGDLKDTLLRVPMWAMFTRPRLLNWDDTEKSKYRMKIDYRKKED